jgi:hypothetical protein
LAMAKTVQRISTPLRFVGIALMSMCKRYMPPNALPGNAGRDSRVGSMATGPACLSPDVRRPPRV